MPNEFEDQMMYKKIFHYLIVNECIADIHLRLSKIGEDRNTNSIPITISNFKKNSEGFIEFSMSEISKDQGKNSTAAVSKDK